jgi:hypothetical protein
MPAINVRAGQAVGLLRPGATTRHKAGLLETGSGRLTGVPTGEASGLDVIDIDTRHGGNECLFESPHRLGSSRCVLAYLATEARPADFPNAGDCAFTTSDRGGCRRGTDTPLVAYGYMLRPLRLLLLEWARLRMANAASRRPWLLSEIREKIGRGFRDDERHPRVPDGRTA